MSNPRLVLVYDPEAAIDHQTKNQKAKAPEPFTPTKVSRKVTDDTGPRITLLYGLEAGFLGYGSQGVKGRGIKSLLKEALVFVSLH
ncbi:hypothetical protein F53441_5387 [Fusarium austroafricanum]|uniref:Uncharacterized protein n=1 Tax=Fusarium austroafricanum TaxID=2364996 RepID=A0A8H4KM32_9HYPO|nr:hypothetical protein F53441_5387 [Fusarium austroafricanum]